MRPGHDRRPTFAQCRRSGPHRTCRPRSPLVRLWRRATLLSGSESRTKPLFGFCYPRTDEFMAITFFRSCLDRLVTRIDLKADRAADALSFVGSRYRRGAAGQVRPAFAGELKTMAGWLSMSAIGARIPAFSSRLDGDERQATVVAITGRTCHSPGWPGERG